MKLKRLLRDITVTVFCGWPMVFWTGLKKKLKGSAHSAFARLCLTINQADVLPIVGPTPLEGFYVANGFSGHGFKLAPAIGSLLAQEITGEVREFDT